MDADAVSGRVLSEDTEVVTMTEAKQGLNALVDDLEAGVREKLVVTKHGKIVAVVLAVDEYARLVDARRRAV